MPEPRRSRQSPSAVLQIRDLHVYYGRSHALQGVELTLERGVHAVVGRNGMGKTTLCNAIMGLVPVQRGSIRFEGAELAGLAPHQVAAKGIGSTPQGRRLCPSLTVDEHLRLAPSGRGAWTPDRLYHPFPRPPQPRVHGRSQPAGG